MYVATEFAPSFAIAHQDACDITGPDPETQRARGHMPCLTGLHAAFIDVRDVAVVDVVDHIVCKYADCALCNDVLGGRK